MARVAFASLSAFLLVDLIEIAENLIGARFAEHKEKKAPQKKCRPFRLVILGGDPISRV
jgi:hypothetical protein